MSMSSSVARQALTQRTASGAYTQRESTNGRQAPQEHTFNVFRIKVLLCPNARLIEHYLGYRRLKTFILKVCVRLIDWRPFSLSVVPHGGLFEPASGEDSVRIRPQTAEPVKPELTRTLV